MDIDNSPTILSQSQSHPVRVKLDLSTHKNLESQPRIRILHDFVSKSTASSPPPPNPVVARGAGPTVGDEKGRYNYRETSRRSQRKTFNNLQQPLRARGHVHGAFCSGKLDANCELLSWVSLSLTNDLPEVNLGMQSSTANSFSSFILFDSLVSSS